MLPQLGEYLGLRIGIGAIDTLGSGCGPCTFRRRQIGKHTLHDGICHPGAVLCVFEVAAQFVGDVVVHVAGIALCNRNPFPAHVQPIIP